MTDNETTIRCYCPTSYTVLSKRLQCMWLSRNSYRSVQTCRRLQAGCRQQEHAICPWDTRPHLCLHRFLQHTPHTQQTAFAIFAATCDYEHKDTNVLLLFSFRRGQYAMSHSVYSTKHNYWSFAFLTALQVMFMFVDCKSWSVAKATKARSPLRLLFFFLRDPLLSPSPSSESSSSLLSFTSLASSAVDERTSCTGPCEASSPHSSLTKKNNK